MDHTTKRANQSHSSPCSVSKHGRRAQSPHGPRIHCSAIATPHADAAHAFSETRPGTNALLAPPRCSTREATDRAESRWRIGHWRYPPAPPGAARLVPLASNAGLWPRKFALDTCSQKYRKFVPRAVRRRAAESAARQRRQGAAARAASHWHSAGARASGCPASGTVTFVASVSGRCPGRHAGCHGGLGQEKGCSLCTGFVCGGGGGGGAARA